MLSVRYIEQTWIDSIDSRQNIAEYIISYSNRSLPQTFLGSAVLLVYSNFLEFALICAIWFLAFLE
jgi:hypothetical protein